MMESKIYSFLSKKEGGGSVMKRMELLKQLTGEDHVSDQDHSWGLDPVRSRSLCSSSGLKQQNHITCMQQKPDPLLPTILSTDRTWDLGQTCWSPQTVSIEGVKHGARVLKSVFFIRSLKRWSFCSNVPSVCWILLQVGLYNIPQLTASACVYTLYYAKVLNNPFMLGWTAHVTTCEHADAQLRPTIISVRMCLPLWSNWNCKQEVF